MLRVAEDVGAHAAKEQKHDPRTASPQREERPAWQHPARQDDHQVEGMRDEERDSVFDSLNERHGLRLRCVLEVKGGQLRKEAPTDYTDFTDSEKRRGTAVTANIVPAEMS